MSINGLQSVKDSIALEKALRKQKSVKAYVNIASGKATVVFNPRRISLDLLFDVIIDMGYFATVNDNKEQFISIEEQLDTGGQDLYFNKNILSSRKDYCAVDLIASTKVTGTQLLSLAAGVVKGSRCVYGNAITDLAAQNSIRAISAAILSDKLHGIEADANGSKILIGDRTFMEENMVALNKTPAVSSEHTAVYISIAGYLLGFFVLSEMMPISEAAS